MEVADDGVVPVVGVSVLGVGFAAFEVITAGRCGRTLTEAEGVLGGSGGKEDEAVGLVDVSSIPNGLIGGLILKTPGVERLSLAKTAGTCFFGRAIAGLVGTVFVEGVDFALPLSRAGNSSD